MWGTDFCSWCGQGRLHGAKPPGNVKARKALERLSGEQRAFQEGTVQQEQR